MSDVLILIVCIALLTLALGLPLLFRPDSELPDMLCLGFFALIVLYFAWSKGDWWILLPCAAFVALVLWMDRDRPDLPLPDPSPGRYGMSERTWLRFQLWRWANRVGSALVYGSIILLLMDWRVISLGLAVNLLLISLVASNLFRVSFYRSVRRDAQFGTNPVPAPASPAPLG